MSTAVELETIHPNPNLEAALQLLERAALPTSDLTEAHMRHFFFLGSPPALLGLVGLEFHGPDALLRSLVVAPEHRSQGAGARLMERAEAYARDRGAVAVYLLTTTAERYFRARGYTTSSRAHAPAGIRETTEFSSLCPAGSAFLFKKL